MTDTPVDENVGRSFIGLKGWRSNVLSLPWVSGETKRSRVGVREFGKRQLAREDR